MRKLFAAVGFYVGKLLISALASALNLLGRWKDSLTLRCTRYIVEHRPEDLNYAKYAASTCVEWPLNVQKIIRACSPGSPAPYGTLDARKLRFYLLNNEGVLPPSTCARLITEIDALDCNLEKNPILDAPGGWR